MTDDKKPEENDNVIPFPAKRKGSDNKNRKPTLFWDGELRHVMGAATAFTLLFFVAMMNYNLFKKDKKVVNQDGRTIASVEDLRDAHSAEKIAKKILEDRLKQDLKVGRTPSSQEKFQFGELSGLYAINYADGKVSKIRFAKSTGKDPKYVNDREKFLLSNQMLFSIKFDSVKKIEQLKKDEFVEEVYELSESGVAKGKVRFTLDKHGRFLSMKVDESIK